jgi:glycosyltransferase involved in cell wall biosynthesis
MPLINLLLLAHNEIDTIKEEICNWERVLHLLPESMDYKIIVVEDGSSDGTSQLLATYHREGRLVHLHEDKRAGYKSALLRGLSACEGDFIFFSDTGMKNDFNDFWALYFRRDAADLLVGRKILRKDSRFRRFLTFSLNLYLNRVFSSSVFGDVDSGFRLFNRKSRDIFLEQKLSFRGFVGCEMVLIIISAGMKYLEVPIQYQGRQGESRGLPNRKIPVSILYLIADIRNFRKRNPM